MDIFAGAVLLPDLELRFLLVGADENGRVRVGVALAHERDDIGGNGLVGARAAEPVAGFLTGGEEAGGDGDHG